MKNLILAIAFSLSVLLGAAVFAPIFAQTQSTPSSPKEALMPNHATGPFEVKVTAQDDKIDPQLGRFLLDKQYHGDLEATGKGQMLSAGNLAQGNGGYVAIEKVTGTLHGRAGSFILQHSGTMKDNVPQMSVILVPGSGTGRLEGIAGTMKINIAAGGKHTYDFEYTLPAD
jgi:hypothetical protein